ncbi:hypothetical protein HID58_052544 [Brassica napus]|uniref:F-box protein n=1 Tax=Brassica napus TaxID=3708 RepID=A0ABQ8AC45_BRANA|nr:hypothetical protein HID58_052544 [Brassica napus]
MLLKNPNLMSAQKVSMRCRDFISSVPDEVLGKILSLLPTRLAASTAVEEPAFTLDFSDEIGNPHGVFDFVDTTLALLSNSSIIKTFSLTFKRSLVRRHCESSRVDKWVQPTVLEGGFLELHLDKSELFTSNTLVKLTLTNEFFLVGLGPLGGVFFPNLKSLSLVSVGYGHPSACNGFGFIPSIQVSNPAIKIKRGAVARKYTVDLGSLVEARLDIRSKEGRVLVVEEDCFDVVEDDGYDDDDDEDSDIDNEDDSESILDIESAEEVLDGDENNDTEDDNDSGYGEYNDIEVVVDEDDDDDLMIDDPNDILPDVTDLVAGISNVKTLHLSSDSLEVTIATSSYMFHLYCKSVPVFHSLLTLSFESDKEKGWQVLPLLLNNSPNLETLVIKGLLHKVTDRCGDACVCIAKKKK